VLVDIDKRNNKGVCDDVLGYGKIITFWVDVLGTELKER
jgi:hypothetical protein